MLRKPFVIGRHMYTNGVRVSAVPAINRTGYLAHSEWIRVDGDAHLAQGEAIFRGECMACHTIDTYRSMKALLGDRDRQAIGNLLAMLHGDVPDSPYRVFMPPMAGTPADVIALGDYLATLNHAKPAPGAAR
jgi:mono/diheme cytochrome c family protein